MSILAVDIGGTKISAGVVDDNGLLRDRVDALTPGETDADGLFAIVAALVDRVRDDDQVACGVGCGGPMTSWGDDVSPLNIPAWRDFPLRSRLAVHTGLDVFVDNDAKALALGEGWVGGARDTRNYLGMVVSTGVGGGIVLDGRLLDGTSGNAGHIGHIIVEPDGNLCPCGARGCLEAETSGTAIQRLTGRPASESTPAMISHVGVLVGRGVASVANLLDLQLAVVAGSVALGFGAPFFAAAQHEIDLRCKIAFARTTRIVPAQLGGSGPLIGAAAVARQHAAQA